MVNPSGDLSQLEWPGQPLSPENYSIDFETLGTGSCATVYYARRKDNACFKKTGEAPKEIVLKVVSNEAKIAMLHKEVSILARLQNHPNIVGFYGVYHMHRGMKEYQETEDENSYGSELPCWAVQMEFCAEDLYDSVRKTRFTESAANAVMVDILKGLAYIHDCGYVHRDVKPENVLLTVHNSAKLADFGISCHKDDKEAMKVSCGSPGYAAPELLLRQEYGVKVDSFSAGALLYFIISGRVAFSGSSIESVMLKTIQNPVNFRKSPRLESLSKGCKAFISALLEKDPQNRPDAHAALDMMAWTATEDHGKASPRKANKAYDDVRLSQQSTSCGDSSYQDTSFRDDSFRDIGSARSTNCTSRYDSTHNRYDSQGSQGCGDAERSEFEDIAMMCEYQPRKPEEEHSTKRSPWRYRFSATQAGAKSVKGVQAIAAKNSQRSTQNESCASPVKPPGNFTRQTSNESSKSSNEDTERAFKKPMVPAVPVSGFRRTNMLASC
jgi:serine/threonine protein kinase